MYVQIILTFIRYYSTWTLSTNFEHKLTDRKVHISDFGSAKLITENNANIVFITARWYRAAELLLGKRDYNEKIVREVN